MTKTYLPVLIGLILVGAVGLFVYSQNRPTATPASSTPASQTSTNTDGNDVVPAASAQMYTFAQVAQHDGATSCWTIIRGSIYDLTSWIANHPGGERAILGLCGEDGTEDFTERHGGQALQEAALASFKIGVLAN